MSRQALVIGDAVGTEDIGPTLARYGIDRIRTAADVSEALVLLGQFHVELVFVPIDSTSEPVLTQLDRAARRDRSCELIGTAPKQDTELMLRAMRTGIQEFLVRPIVTTELAAAMERVRRRVTMVADAGVIYAVYSTKGGIGVSSVAASLATALAALNKASRVAVVDLVVPNGEQRLMFNAAVPYDIGDVASKAERLDAELLNSVLAPVRDGVLLLASTERPEAAEAVDAGIVAAVLGHLRSSCAFTIIDCEHQLNDRTLAALDAAERIVYVTQLNVSALRGAQTALGLFRRLGYPSDKLCVVVNRFQSGDVLSLVDASNVLKTDIFFSIPNDYKSMAESLTRGVPVTDVQTGAKIAAAFEQLAQKLGGPLGSHAEGKNGTGSRLKQLFSRKKG